MSRVFTNAQVNPNETYVHTPASAVYNNLVAASYAFWVRITSYAGAGLDSVILIKDPINTGAVFLNIDDAGHLRGYIDNATNPASVSTEVISLSAWTHVVYSYNYTGDKKVHLYINGAEVTYSGVQHATGSNAPTNDSADGFYFGNDTFDNNGFTGDIAEAAVWNTQLSAGNITTLAASTTGAAGVASGNLVGYWHLCGSLSPEPDSTANGNNGVLNGSPAKGPDSPGFSCGGFVPQAGAFFVGI